MKLRAPITIFALAVFCVPLQSLASSGGITGYSGNPTTHSGDFCIACHSGGQAPTVSLTGPSEIVAGESAEYTLSISGGQSNLAGFNISSNGGVLNINIANTSKSGNELKHNQPFSVASDSSYHWQFNLTAPNAPGTVTLYAAVLSANGNSSPDGDNAAAISLNVTVTAAAKPLPPTAVIQAPANAQFGATVNFDASASSSDSSITRYLWDFGDGSALQTGVSVSHQYDVAGAYTVTLAVTDDKTTANGHVGLTGVVAQTITIGDGSSTAQGEALYNTYCQGCHGPGGGGGSAPAITGVSVAQIQTALTNIQVMQSISLSDTEIQLIVDYLANSGGTPLPRPTDGPGLYGLLCAGCHGSDGGGASAKGITGAPFIMIAEALTNIAAMQSIVISDAEIQQVASFLLAGGAVSIPSDGAGLYGVFCAVCHGAGGHGGKFKAVTGAPLTMINSAISQQAWMQDLSLSSSQRSAIAGFLSAGGSAPLPSDGAGLYGVFCAVCHGSDGRGDKYKVVTGASSSFVQRALNNVSLMQSLNPSSSQQNAITTFLASGGGGAKPTTGSGLYHVYCETCHGINGNGGPYEGVRGASSSSISSQINSNSNMSQLGPYLNSSDRSLISSFLGGGGGGGN